MAQRYKVYKNPVQPGWLVQAYGTETAVRTATWQGAMRFGSGRWPSLPLSFLAKHSIGVPLLDYPEEYCHNCGRRLTYQENTYPGGGGSFQYKCTNLNCDYEYADGF